jgi:hypothetical protein
VRSSVPPIPAYNERLGDPRYLDNIRKLLPYEPWADQQPNWQALKAAGITHIYIGSRGGALSPSTLLKSDQARLAFHKDSVWLFEVR